MSGTLTGYFSFTKLSDAEFAEISQLVRTQCGINLHQGKKELVQERLQKRLRALGLRSFRDYIRLVMHDDSGQELVIMLNLLSTNLTSFFREPDHFKYLEKLVAATSAATAKKRQPTLRIWSAGCSSGQEPYSIAITVYETLRQIGRDRDWNVAILATDLDTQMLQRASEAKYPEERLSEVPAAIRFRYFQPAGSGFYAPLPAVRECVYFARLNLMDSWPMRGPFDAIFCRNVMIYFDKSVQADLVGRFWNLLAEGGSLFLGHSEGLTGLTHRFKYAQPTVYVKSRS